MRTTAALQAAHELIPTIERLRDATERDRCLAADAAEGIRRSGLARMTLPNTLGGLGTSTVEALRVYELLAAAEASASWITWNSSLPCLFGRYLDPAARAEIFSDSAWMYGNSTRPSGTATSNGDGYQVQGRWSLVSGCQLVQWLALHCVVLDGDGRPRLRGPDAPELRLVYLRSDQCQIVDTWYVGGLRGTGSHDVTVENVRVPAAHTAVLGGPCGVEAPIDRVPVVSTLAAGFAAQALGVAANAVDAVLQLAKTKVSPGRPGLKDQARCQEAVATHRAALNAARGYLHGAVGHVWDKAAAQLDVEIDDIAAVWGAALHADRVSREAVDAMYATGGTSSLYTSFPVERSHRDLHAMMRHTIAQPNWLEQSGRAMLGLEITDPLFML